MVGKPEVMASVLVNAVTGQVKSAQNHLSGHPTNQGSARRNVTEPDLWPGRTSGGRRQKYPARQTKLAVTPSETTFAGTPRTLLNRSNSARSAKC